LAAAEVSGEDEEDGAEADELLADVD
jgi:hypothetical protein